LSEISQNLLHQIKTLEQELGDTLEEKEKTFRYHWLRGKARFEEEVLRQHRKLKVWLPKYLLQSRALAVITAPVIYAGIIPFVLVDLFLLVYQAICFPVYGIPKVKRSEYIVFDRGHLAYLNLLERLNCAYCSYANGLVAYLREIAARTEQHWCPIKHAQRLRAPHSRYQRFLDYGDAVGYQKRIDKVRSDFVDITKAASRS